MVDVLSDTELKEFEKIYRTDIESKALRARGQFIEAFPIRSLSKLELKNYVIGRRQETFCYFVEVATRHWARITGATAFKFGVYFGKTKNESAKKYRFAGKYGDSTAAAFRKVRTSLVSLVEEGAKTNPNFRAIDQNPLSSMFKAKVLSLYFPSKFINICSERHLKTFAKRFKVSNKTKISEIQRELLRFKSNNLITSGWSHPKYMAFLYYKYEGKTENTVKIPRRIDFRLLQERKDARGRAAEEFALRWEKQRLRGDEAGKLIKNIRDRRDRPGYGYDFLSHNSDGTERLIEVKSVQKLNEGGNFRFYASSKQKEVAGEPKHQLKYYLYLVYFDEKGKPADLDEERAYEFYHRADIDTDTYVVRFKTDSH
jgi:hypothetical protein